MNPLAGVSKSRVNIESMVTENPTMKRFNREEAVINETEIIAGLHCYKCSTKAELEV